MYLAQYVKRDDGGDVILPNYIVYISTTTSSDELNLADSGWLDILENKRA